MIAHVELEGLESIGYLKAQLWQSAGITSTTARNIENTANTALKEIKPYAEGAATGLKYAGITAGILLGGPAGIILGIPALGLTLTKDIAHAVNPDNPKVEAIPEGLGETVGLVADKTTEAATGQSTNGLLQNVGGFLETVLTGTKDLLKKAKPNQPKALVAIDKTKTASDTYKDGEKVVIKIDQAIEQKKDEKKEGN
ncbi:hypothetical protein COR50_21720 [Chitinophaga caeni]|uniref:Uncharacterized protein n=1 Tax=Chitinophaga caeni TaxID=2029983 RepID=A0A291R089_9BACT|nr:hypothetical protein COR50_21720 [Chitinophaga caeni]